MSNILSPFQVLFMPGRFFSSILSQNDKTLFRKAVQFSIITGLISGLVGILVVFLNSQSLSAYEEIPFIGKGNTGSLLLIIPAFSIIRNLGSLLIGSVIAFFVFKIIKINGSYNKIIALLAYAHAPTALLEWVPIASSYIIFYEYFLLAVGMHVMFAVPKKKATIIFGVLAILSITRLLGGTA